MSAHPSHNSSFDDGLLSKPELKTHCIYCLELKVNPFQVQIHCVRVYANISVSEIDCIPHSEQESFKGLFNKVSLWTLKLNNASFCFLSPYVLASVLCGVECAAALKVTMDDGPGEWGMEKEDCAFNNHPDEKSFSVSRNKSNNRPITMATTGLFKEESWDLGLINTPFPCCLSHSLLLSLFLSFFVWWRRPAGLNDGLMDVRLKLGNHSSYVATSITAATNIISHMSRSPDSVGAWECVKKWSECVLDSLMEGPGSGFDGHPKESHSDSVLCIVWVG